MSVAGAIEDWTEKYRPTSMSQMEGNDSQLRMIAQWLDRWSSGKIVLPRADRAQEIHEGLRFLGNEAASRIQQ